MPYRSNKEVETVRFPLRTPPLFLAFVWSIAAVTALSVGLLLFGLQGGTQPFFIFVTVALVVFLVAFWATTEPYRIGGGKGELVVEADVLSVPGHRRGEVVRLPLSGLAFQRAPVRVRFSMFAGAVPVATVRRGEVIILRHGLTSRTLSTLTSPDPLFADKLMRLLTERNMPAPELEKLEALMDEVFRTFAATAPRTRVSSSAPPEEDAELERRIDEELRAEND